MIISPETMRQASMVSGLFLIGVRETTLETIK